jgi:DNA mismatch repair protein MutS2
VKSVFAAGDLVHVASLGKGTVREVRNNERYLVEVKGRSLVVTGAQLSLQPPSKKSSPPKTARAPREYEDASAPPQSLDLHGKTVAEALDLVSAFINTALLAGSAEARVIHGRSGGKIRSAVHAQLKGMSVVRGFRVDPQNEGVTIVKF